MTDTADGRADVARPHMGRERPWGKGNLHGSAGRGGGLSGVNGSGMGWRGASRYRGLRAASASMFLRVNLAAWGSAFRARSIHEHRCCREAARAAAMAYRHANPVRHGFTAHSGDWPLSTVYRREPATADGKTPQVGLYPDAEGWKELGGVAPELSG